MIVEREHQLAVFRRSLTDCAAGVGGSLVLTGPPANGKSTLLATFVDEAAEAGFRCLTASGSRAERALPFGVVNQLCPDGPFTLPPGEQVDLALTVPNTTMREDPAQTSDHLRSVFFSAICAAVVELSRQAPVLICVDDLHHIDPPSLQCLVYLVRRIHSSRILVITAGSDLITPTHTALHTELLDHETTGRVYLGPLSAGGVSRVLAAQLGVTPAVEVVTACHTSTRGNPLLVSALAQDLDSSMDRDHLDSTGAVRTGPAFERAVRRCVDRYGVEAQRLLVAGAVLAESLATTTVSAALIGRLAGIDPAVIERRFAELETTGLLAHQSARLAVLASLPPAELATKRLLAALLLHDEGAEAPIVARHLLAAGRPVGNWAVPVLRSAADHLLDKGDTVPAIKLLQMAHDSSSDKPDRASVKVLRLRAEWRTNPAAATRHLADLTAAIHDGLLAVPDALVIIGHLLWFGFVDKAEHALERAGLDADHYTASEVRLATVWARHSYPGLAGQEDRDPGTPAHSAHPEPNGHAFLADALQAIFSTGTSDQAFTAAEQTLQRARLDDATVLPIVAALTALIYTNHLDTAAKWFGLT